MPPTTLRDWFCLNSRETFTIDPKVNTADAKFYFGRDKLRDRLKEQISRAFIDPQVPKMMLYGAYGSGKTHTLYHLAHHLSTKKPVSCTLDPHVVHLEIEIKSDYRAAKCHLQLTDSLQEAVVQGWLRTLYENSSDFDAQITRLTSQPNVRQAFKQLRGSGQLASTAWRWLTGQALAARELQDIGVTRQLSAEDATGLADALLAIGNLARAVGKCPIFFVNEMEALQNLRQGDPADSWHDYFRKLSDTSNSSVGFVIALKADTLDDAPRILTKQDITSRIGRHNLIELETLAAPSNVKTFVEDMLTHLIDETKAQTLISSQALPTELKRYPFTPSAFELMCDYACQDPHKSTPRNIIKTINECAMTAWDAEPKKRIIDDSIVSDIAPVVFG